MSNLQEIERAVSQLSVEELAAFRVWFAEFDAELWDRHLKKMSQQVASMDWLNKHCNIYGTDAVLICDIPRNS